MLEKLLAGGVVAAQSPAPKEGEMKALAIPLGTVFTLTSSVQVRNDVGEKGTLLGIQATGSVGTITAGPLKATDHMWYQVDFATGIDGWCLAGGLREYTNLRDILPHPATKTRPEAPYQPMNIKAQIDYVRAKLASTTNPLEQQHITELLQRLLQQQVSGTLMWKPKASSILDWLQNPVRPAPQNFVSVHVSQRPPTALNHLTEKRPLAVRCLVSQQTFT